MPATQVQFRRGTTAQTNAFTGAVGEVTVNTSNWTLVVQDGTTAGGNPVVGTTATQTLTNKTIQAATFTGAASGSGSLSLTGNITGGNIISTGIVSASGNVTGNYVLGNGFFLTGVVTSSSNISNGTSNVTVVSSGGNVALSVGGTSNVAVWSTLGQFITGILSVTGNISGGVVSVNSPTTAIVNAASNGVGNIGSTTSYFGAIFATASSALYADLAEMYEADAQYEPGTVVSFGGSHQITVSKVDADRAVAGVVSTNPSYLMNMVCSGQHPVPVALTGLTPTKVTGTIKKGDMVVSNGDGTARAESNPQVGSVIGKSLEDFDGPSGIINVVIGRF